MLTQEASSALEYFDRGWNVIPLRDKRQPLIKWTQERVDRATVEGWWAQWPNAWIGVVLGKSSNMIRIDCDGAQAMVELMRFGGVPDTLAFTTPSGGSGWLYEYMPGCRTETVWKGEGEHQELRIQSDGAYTVVPPSPGYTWCSNCEPRRVPEWLERRIVESVLNDLEKELSPIYRDPVDDAEVHRALEFLDADDYDMWIHVGMALFPVSLELWIAWSKKSFKFKDGECEQRWSTFNEHGRRLTPRSILYWAEKHGFKRATRYETIDDSGNAKILARIGAGKILHSEVWDWLAWDGKRWDKKGAWKPVQELQKEAIQIRYDAARDSLIRHLRSNPEAVDFEKRKKQKQRTLDLLKKYRDEPHYRGARVLASSDPRLSIDYRMFNQHPMLLNCLNGTVDLETGELMEHCPAHYITQLCPTEYNKDAECPRWLQFLREVFEDKQELIHWMHKLLGYCTSGDTGIHILPIFYGTGRNGKSTLLTVIHKVLGDDYAYPAPGGFTAAFRANVHTPHEERFVQLYQKRFVMDIETSDTTRLNEDLIKRLTGGDEITARDLYEKRITFPPTHKLIIATNYEPTVRGQDDGIWGRIRKVPFTVNFEELGVAELRLSERIIREEGPGVLRWLVEGCIMCFKEGLGRCATVDEATREYKGEQDTIAQFLKEKYEVLTDESNKIKKGDVTGVYTAWCYLNGNRAPLHGRALGEALKRNGVRQSDCRNYYFLKTK